MPSEEILKTQSEIDKLGVEFFSDMQVYLKVEWNRVKYESKGKIYEKETQMIDLAKLKERKSKEKTNKKYRSRFVVNIFAKIKRILNLDRWELPLIKN